MRTTHNIPKRFICEICSRAFETSVPHHGVFEIRKNGSFRITHCGGKIIFHPSL